MPDLRQYNRLIFIGLWFAIIVSALGFLVFDASTRADGPVIAEMPGTPESKQGDDMPAESFVVSGFSDDQTDGRSATVEIAKAPAMDRNLFAGWSEPKLLLVFTGFMNGYVEPCGCAGMEQMKGGLSRRHTLFKQLEKKGWPVIAVDGGNLNKGFGNQEELKYSFVINEALRLMKYGAAGLGNRELLLPTEVLIAYSIDVPGDPKRYTSANTAILEFSSDCVAPFRVLEKNGMKIGVTSVVANSLLNEINNQDILHENAIKKLKEVLPALEAAKCDRTALIIFGTTGEVNEIIAAVPGKFDFILGSDTPAEPPLKPNKIGDSFLIEVGEKGKFAVVVGLFDDPKDSIRYQRIPLDSRFENSPEILDLMKLYQDQLRDTGLEGLGIKPIPDRRTEENGRFVGSKVCADCHEPSYRIWRKSKHAAAWRTLQETSKPERTHDPECIACHAVGWNPKEFLPYENGFMGVKKTPSLVDVGCESCHGPGENHVKAESGGDAALQARLRKAVRLPLEGNAARKACIECHDGDNSPHFDFETYWPKIEHWESEVE